MRTNENWRSTADDGKTLMLWCHLAEFLVAKLDIWDKNVCHKKYEADFGNFLFFFHLLYIHDSLTIFV
jgi:hypothetical protein